MLIYEIIRHIMYPNTEDTLNCIFHKGIGSINVIVTRKDSVEILKLEFNPEISVEVPVITIQVPVLLSSQNE